MGFVRRWMLVVAIEAAVSLLVIASPGDLRRTKAGNFKDICDKLDREMSANETLQVDREKAFEFAKNWMMQKQNCNYLQTGRRNKVIEAWENIYKGECSNSSWNYLLDMTRYCKHSSNLQLLNEPLEAYAKNCLTPDYAGEKIKWQVGGRNFADFVDADFIQKFYKDNPKDIPLHINWIGDKYWLSLITPGLILSLERRRPDPDLNCCRAERSLGAVEDAIKRDFAKQGKDAYDEFHNKPDALSEYLEEKLFKSCENLVRRNIPLPVRIGEITQFYVGGQQALIASLKQETKDSLFRYKYCEMLWLDKQLVLDETQKMFVHSKSQSS